ncbi:15679_t:CDS:2 [Gigaspora rosea]|nr:15679_t:CDS:2 [Gigaspora rosea]
MTEHLQNNRKRKSKENGWYINVIYQRDSIFSETVQLYGQEYQENQEVDDAEIDKIVVNKVSALLFSNLNLEEIWIKVMDRLKKDNLPIESRIVDLSDWTKVEWNRILKVVHEEYTAMGNTGLMDYTKYLIKLKIAMKDCLDTLRSKLHFKEAELEGVFTSEFKLLVATLILPTTFSNIEDLLPSFLESFLHYDTRYLTKLKKIREVAQRRLSTPLSPLHNTANSAPYMKKQKEDPFEILDYLY